MSKTAGQKKILLSHEFCRCLRVLPLRLQRFLRYCRRFRILPAVLRPLSACDNMAVTAHFNRPLFIFFCGVNMQRRTPSHVLSLINFIMNMLRVRRWRCPSPDLQQNLPSYSVRKIFHFPNRQRKGDYSNILGVEPYICKIYLYPFLFF